MDSPIRHVDRVLAGPAAHLHAGPREREPQLRYKIALLETEDGFSVSVPGLPGCWSQGATEQEALENIQDAIQAYLATRAARLEGAVVREIEIAS